MANSLLMAEKTVHVHDRKFGLFITEQQIKKTVKKIARSINRDFNDQPVIFLAILNGSFMFAADLLRQITIPDHRISFIKLASYQGTTSTGVANRLIGLSEDLRGKVVIIIEDVIDTGVTVDSVARMVATQGCKTVCIATLLLKPHAYKGARKPDYVGMEIPNDFVVGYGLDYNGYARNLKDIYHEIH